MSDEEQGTGNEPGTGSDRRAFLKKMAVLGGGAFAASTVMSFTLDGSASAMGRKPIGGGGNTTIGGGGNLGGGGNTTIGGHHRDKDDDRDEDDRKRKRKRAR